MNVDLLPIINNEEQKLPFEGDVNFTENDVTVSSHVVGSAKNFAGRLEITAHIKATVNTSCARCVKPLSVPIELDVNETVGEDEISLNGTVLDISSIVIQNIVVNLPIRYLCSEDCKGICGKCGADLNTSKCNCEDDNIDERFAQLKSLLE